MPGCYVTGTDTEIGKTWVSCRLLRALVNRGVDAVGMKPVASGCAQTPDGLRNADAVDLMAAGASRTNYADVNPYAFVEPIAPHLAAANGSIVIDVERIAEAHARLVAQSGFVIVEGVGGWLAPLGDVLMQADLVRRLELPVVLVVGLRLGCINHALLTLRAIEADGCRLTGWIANQIDPSMRRAEDNIRALQSRIQAPLLGIVEHGVNASGIAGDVDLSAAVPALLAADPLQEC
jgi:dethiobiotin synthetase